MAFPRSVETDRRGRFAGKIVLVTGAGQGIGRACVSKFLRESADVVAVDRDEDALRDLAESHADPALRIFRADISSPGDEDDYVARVVREYGRLDVAVLNAGIEGTRQLITRTAVEDFDRVVAVNLRGTWLGLARAMAAMEASGGAITLTSSIAGLRGSIGLAPYSATKHAVVGLMKTAALEGAPHGIRVNSVHPGPIATRMLDDAAPTSYKVGTPEQIADVIAFVSSDEASYCSGSTIVADGSVMAGSPLLAGDPLHG